RMRRRMNLTMRMSQMNNKLLLAGLGFMFGCGSLVGYFLSRWDLQSSAAIANSQQITPGPVETRKDKLVDIRTVKPVKSPRELLEEKYRLCVGNNGDLSKVPDSVMNQVIQRACTEKS
ncbi:MAG: hypothetical protein ACKPCM_12090, partial [Pseudanabaena sp.]